MAEKTKKATATTRATGSGAVAVEVLHPITYENSVYTRGLHYVPRAVADFFLSIRVPNRVEGPQCVARLPVPAEGPKIGEVKPMGAEE